jgi:hypothetical protein
MASEFLSPLYTKPALHSDMLPQNWVLGANQRPNKFRAGSCNFRIDPLPHYFRVAGISAGDGVGLFGPGPGSAALPW